VQNGLTTKFGTRSKVLGEAQTLHGCFGLKVVFQMICIYLWTIRLETPAEAAPTPALSPSTLLRINSAEGPPDAGRESPARWFPVKN